MVTDQQPPAPVFFSRLFRAVAGLSQEKAPASQWRAIVGNLSGKGVRKEEVAWSGLPDWLDARGDSVIAKTEVLSALRANDIQLSEVVKDEISPADLPSSVRYPEYRLPGGVNYRELLLTLPPREADPNVLAGEMFGKYVEELSAAERQALEQALLDQRIDNGRDFISDHWAEVNVLAHIRFDERTSERGERILHIAELQSDWHQIGRRRGYDGDADRSLFVSTVPDAPFRSTWHELAFRRMVRFAAEHGFDRVTWDTGETNAVRFGMSKRVEQIRYVKRGDDVYDVWASDRFGAALSAELDWNDLGAADLIRHLGKDIAQKVIGNEGADDPENPGDKVLSGLDLQAGGDGMRVFYDQILPAYAAKFSRPFDGAVTLVTGILERPVHSLIITPAMRETALKDGFPLFQRQDAAMSMPSRDIPTEALVPPRNCEPGAAWRHGSLLVVPIARNLLGVISRRSGDQLRVSGVADVLADSAAIMTPYATVEIYDALFDVSGPMPEAVDGATFGRRDEAGDLSAIVIAVSAAGDDPIGTFAHETVHYVRRTRCLTDEEYDILSQHAAEWIERFGIAERYGRDNSDTHREEASAFAFAAYVGGHAGFEERTAIGRGTGAAGNAAAASPTALTLSPEAQGIFDRIAGGSVGERYATHGLGRATVLSDRVDFRRDRNDKATLDLFSAEPPNPRSEPGAATAPPPVAEEPPLRLEQLNARWLVIRGTDLAPYRDRLESTGGRWSSAASGFMFDSARYDDIVAAFSDALSPVTSAATPEAGWTNIPAEVSVGSGAFALGRDWWDRLSAAGRRSMAASAGWTTGSGAGDAALNSIGVRNAATPWIALSGADRSALMRAKVAADTLSVNEQVEPSSPFNPAHHVLIAADSVQTLRQADVYRLFETAPRTIDAWDDLRIYLIDHRPDLAAEVFDVQDEIGRPPRPTDNGLTAEDRAAHIAQMQQKGNRIQAHLRDGGHVVLRTHTKATRYGEEATVRIGSDGVYFQRGNGWDFAWDNQLDDMLAQIDAAAVRLRADSGPEAGEAVAPTMLQDAGEKIGGARKDKWAERGLNLADLTGMSHGEAAKFVTKDAVWPKPNFTALVAGGMHPTTAALVKLIRDKLAAKPASDTPEGRHAYVQMLGYVRGAFEAAKTPEDLKAARLRVIYEDVGWPRNGGISVRPTPQQSALLFSIFKGRKETLSFAYSDLRKAQAMVNSGFPAEPERPWLKGVEMGAVPGYGVVVRRNGKLLKSGFADEDAARTYLEQDWQVRHNARAASGGLVPERPHLDKVVRSGADVRHGRDVTGEDFLTDFGFRGIEFGNWVASDERQKSVNLAYEALYDLASILDISPRALSLEGRLGLAFGARGNGSARAHYEPAKLVINMTKLRSAGTLAHEWAHALDHYFGELDRPDAYQGRARGASGWYEKEARYDGKPRRRLDLATRLPVEEYRLPHLRPEMAQAFDLVMDAIFQRDKTAAEFVRECELGLEQANGMLARWERAATVATGKAVAEATANVAFWKDAIADREAALARARDGAERPAQRVESSFYADAKALSGKSGADGYWARPTEMFARAMEAYVFDRLGERGDRSDYLVHGVEAARYAGDDYRGNPYPTDLERESINAAFDHLFEEMGERMGTGDNVALYSRVDPDAPPVLRVFRDIPLNALTAPVGHPRGAPWVNGSLRMVSIAPGLVGVSSRRAEDVAHAHAVASAIAPLWETVAPSAEVEVYEALYALGAEGELPEEVEGAFFARPDADGRVDMVIAVSARAGDPARVFAHEALHFLKRTGCFTNEEYAILSNQADGWIATHRIDRLYPDHDYPARVEESVASALAAYAGGRWRRGDDGGWYPVGAGDSAAVEAVVAEQAVADIFGRILSGDVGARFQPHADWSDAIYSVALARDRWDKATGDLFAEPVRDASLHTAPVAEREESGSAFAEDAERTTFADPVGVDRTVPDPDVIETRRGLEVDRATLANLSAALAQDVDPDTGRGIRSEGRRIELTTEAEGLEIAIGQAEEFLAAHGASDPYSEVSARFGIDQRAVVDLLTQPVDVLRDRDRYFAPSNTTTPTADFPRLPIGTARITAYNADAGDAYVSYLREVHPSDVVPTEAEDGIRQRDPSYPLYVQWFRDGFEAPPIHAFENERGGAMLSSNRRRVLAAQEAGIARLVAWYGPFNRETGLPLKLRDVRAAFMEARARLSAPAAETAGGATMASALSAVDAFTIAGQEALAPVGQAAKVAANLAALRVVKELARSGRRANAEEQDALARYSGWGHSPQIFDEARADWAERRTTLRTLLTDTEYEAARLSTLNAHYTSHEVTSAIWQTVRDLGFDAGRVLEPGCGTGNFIGALPPQISDRTRFVGVELDPTTAAIAQHLYPSAEIRNEGFEATRLAANSFDLMIGNVPFGQIALHDPIHNKAGHSIHNHFIVKSLALVKPGAVLAVVTSRYTMDGRNPSARRDIADHADLLGAIRLPDTAFRVNAGTDVVTDILFFRKRLPGEPALDQSWVRTTDIDKEKLSSEGNSEEPIFINHYFAERPDHVLGSFALERNQFGMGLTVKPAVGDASLAEQIGRVSSAIVASARADRRTWNPITLASSAEESRDVQEVARADVKEGAFYVADDGRVLVRENGYAIDAKVPPQNVAEVAALIGLRDAVHAVLTIQARVPATSGQTDASPPWAAAQDRLNALYDDYVVAYGPINRFKPISRGVDENGEEVIHRRYPKFGGFRRDPDFASVLALEHFDDDTQAAFKAPVFDKRVINAPREIRGADDAHGALMAVLEATGRVDLGRMADLLGTDQAAVVAELRGAIYHDPALQEWVTADQYLSGNVRVKLREAEAASAVDPSFLDNAEALRKVQPRDLLPRDIKARLGAPWIPASDVEAFVREILESDDIRVGYAPLINSWDIAAPSRVARSPISRTVLGTTRRDAITLLEDALNGRPSEVFDVDAEGKRTKNPKATLDACEKREKLSEQFSRWIWQDADRAVRLAAHYNETYNATVLRSFDGSHLRLPGLSAAITPRAHQRNVVWRIVQDGNTLMAHTVGAGKTLASIMASQEEKRLGLVNKPAFSVPNHMLEQFAREFKQAYPMARLLLADRDETSPEARKAFIAKCAMGDWDAVIFTHNTFGAIPVSIEAQANFIREQVADLEEAIRAAAAESDRNPSVKNLEKAKKSLGERLRSLLAAENKDDGLTFEMTGIDRLYVDELHLFKNLAFHTKRPGVSTTASQRAEDLYLKKEILEDRTPGRSLVGMTGTPIANRVAEMYVNQLYFDRPGLEARGVRHFDAWANAFGEDVTAIELAPDGASFRMTTRFAKYINTPELLSHFRQFTDVQTADMLKLPVPALKGGKPQVVSVPANDQQKAYIADIQKRIELIREGLVDPRDDNMLKVTSDGRKAAADMRLLGFPANDNEATKAAVVGGQIARIYAETKDLAYPALHHANAIASQTGALQVVFCDLGTPKKDGSFSMYDAIRDAAIAGGVPADRVRFIHDYATDEAKARLFADCRAGRVSVLFGSTEKMGVGTNIQDRLYAVHHVDCPWRPVDIEQRDGRKDRQGNLHYDLGIPTETLIYGTEGTFDVYMWQTAERKARFIAQIMKGDLETREIEDIDGQALSYAEAKAILTGNPILMEKASVDAEVAKLQRAARNHLDDQQNLRQSIDIAERRITILRASADEARALKERVSLPPADGPVTRAVPLTIAGFHPEQVAVRPSKTAGEKNAVSPEMKRRDQFAAITFAAGSAILSAVRREWKSSLEGDRGAYRRVVGTYAGLPLIFETGGRVQSNTVKIFLEGLEQKSLFVDILRLPLRADGVWQLRELEKIVSGLSDEIARLDAAVAEEIESAERSRSALAGFTAFPHNDRLDHLLDRQSEINRQLALDVPVVDFDAEGSALEDGSDFDAETLGNAGVYDERDGFDPRDRHSYEAGQNKASSYIHRYEGEVRFDVTPFCRELGRAADDGNRARALGLVHHVLAFRRNLILDVAENLAKQGSGRGNDYRGKKAAREFVALACATAGFGLTVPAMELVSDQRWTSWVSEFRAEIGLLHFAQPKPEEAGSYQVSRLMEAVVDEDGFGELVIAAAFRLGTVSEPEVIARAVLQYARDRVSAVVHEYVTTTSDYTREQFYKRPGAIQRALLDMLPSEAAREQYLMGHRAYEDKQADMRRRVSYYSSAHYAGPVAVSAPETGLLRVLERLISERAPAVGTDSTLLVIQADGTAHASVSEPGATGILVQANIVHLPSVPLTDRQLESLRHWAAHNDTTGLTGPVKVKTDSASIDALPPFAQSVPQVVEMLQMTLPAEGVDLNGIDGAAAESEVTAPALPPSFRDCVEEAVRTPDPLRGAWLSSHASRWAAYLERQANLTPILRNAAESLEARQLPMVAPRTVGALQAPSSAGLPPLSFRLAWHAANCFETAADRGRDASARVPAETISMLNAWIDRRRLVQDISETLGASITGSVALDIFQRAGELAADMEQTRVEALEGGDCVVAAHAAGIGSLASEYRAIAASSVCVAAQHDPVFSQSLIDSGRMEAIKAAVPPLTTDGEGELAVACATRGG